MRIAVAILILLMIPMTVRAWLGTNLPAAAIEYSAGSWASDASGGVLHDVVGSGDSTKWFDADVTSVASIIGYAHSGQSGLTQTQANARVTAIQIWGWLDTNGDGQATIADSRTGARTTKWVKLSELKPSSNSSLDVSGENTSPSGVAIKSDGAKIYFSGRTNPDTIYQYALSTDYDATTAGSVEASLNVSADEADVQDVAFKSDGSKLYIVGVDGDEVNQYAISTPWDISTAGSVEATFSVAGEDGTPRSLDFKSDGTKLYVLGASSGVLYQYPVSTPWDLSTGGATDASLDVATLAGSSNIQCVKFSSDGTKLYVLMTDGGSGTEVEQYPVSPAWDLTGVGAVESDFSVNTQDANPRGFCVSSDGASLYVAGDTSDALWYYRLSTPYDMDTASLAAAGDVVGWEVSTGAPDTTSAWDDILQTSNGGTAVTLAAGESWLLMVRVVNTSGDTNLMDAVSGTEDWEDGDSSNGIGSDDPGDVYGITANGSTDIDDDDVVWVYVRKVGVTMLGREWSLAYIVPRERAEAIGDRLHGG